MPHRLWPLFWELGLRNLRTARNNRTRRRPQVGIVSEVERLEDRTLLSVSSVASLGSISKSGATGEKPQSKVWEHGGQFFTALEHDDGTAVFRLDGTQWTPILTLAEDAYQADVKVDGDLVHILLEDGKDTKLASLQYVNGASGSYQFWSVRPQLASINLGDPETATIDIDSTGRMWVAYDKGSNVVVRYSDGPYTTWSNEIVVASGIKSDDITSVIALPNGTIGVFWSNQSAKRFGFKTHVDGAAPNAWSSDEVPGNASAVSAGKGMADDHLNLKVTSDGTLYAVIKTSYDSSSQVGIGLLVRRPNGTWDKIYSVDTDGTRPTIQVIEETDTIIVAYRNTDGSGPINYRESKISNIAFGAEKVLISQSSANNVSSAKNVAGTKAVFVAGSSSTVYGALVNTQGSSPVPTNNPPQVDAGADLAAEHGQTVFLNGTATDDGYPINPGQLSVTWSQISGPGVAAFENANSIDTNAAFTLAGTYVLQLTASDGQHTRTDQVTVVIAPPAAPTSGPVDVAVPDILTPTGTSNDNTPTFTWTESAGAAAYYLTVKNLDTGEFVYKNKALTGGSVTLTTPLIDGKYRACICAIRPDGSLTEWDIHSFKLFGVETPSGLPETPAMPTLLTPDATTDDNTPTFTWTQVPGAVSYYLTLKNLETGEFLISDKTLKGDSLAVTAPLADGKYRVCLRATFANGTFTEWNIRTFTVATASMDSFFSSLNDTQDPSLLGLLV